MPFAPINGTEIHYEIRGTGQPLVFVHAGISDIGMWDGQWDSFTQNYQVLRHDLRGSGKTKPVDSEYSHIDDLHALLQHLNLTSAILVGCSMCGTTVIDYTLAHPENVKALVVVGADPSGYEMKGDPPANIIKMQESLQQGDLDSAVEYGARVWVDGERRTPNKVDSSVRERVKHTLKIMFGNYGIGKEKPPARPAVDRLHEIAVPTLLMVGDEDHPELIEAAQLMERAIPNAHLVLLADTAHVPSMEKSTEFNHLLARFLHTL